MSFIDKKVAICFSGEPRSLNYTHKSIKDFLDKNFGDYDVYGYIPFCSTSEQLKEYFPNATITMAMDQHIYDNKIPNNNRFPPHSGKQAYLQQINGWKQANLMRKSSEKSENFQYDFVVRCRMDVRYTSQLPEIHPQKHMLYIPNFHHHGGINDRFCIGGPEVIDNYMNIIDLYHENPSICTHAESFLLHCLRQKNTPIEFIDLRFNRIREDGSECHWDSTDP